MDFLLQADGEDELKKRQLMELAIINGTYRDSESMRALAAAGKSLLLFLLLFSETIMYSLTCKLRIRMNVQCGCT